MRTRYGSEVSSNPETVKGKNQRKEYFYKRYLHLRESVYSVTDIVELLQLIQLSCGRTFVAILKYQCLSPAAGTAYTLQWQGVKYKRYHMQFSEDMVSWQETSIIRADANGRGDFLQDRAVPGGIGPCSTLSNRCKQQRGTATKWSSVASKARSRSDQGLGRMGEMDQRPPKEMLIERLAGRSFSVTLTHSRSIYYHEELVTGYAAKRLQGAKNNTNKNKTGEF